MPFIALLVGGLASAGIGAVASSNAAKTQANASNQATQVEQQMFNTTQANLAPFIGSGANGLTGLQAGLTTGAGGVGTGALNTPFNPTNLQNTPGYQFTMQQGLQGVLDSASATGGVGGGNTLKALTSYGQGLASTTYQQQLQDYMAQQAQQFGQEFNVASLGESAAAGQGGLSASVGSDIGSNIVGAGNASAAGQVGSANAITGGINGLTSNYLLASLLGGGGGSSLSGASLFGASV